MSYIQEAISREITIEDDPLILTKIFDYLYCATYDDCCESWSITERAQDAPEQTESAKPSETPTIDNMNGGSQATLSSLTAEGSKARINAEIYVLADKYQVEGLMRLSRQKLQSLGIPGIHRYSSICLRA